MAWPDSTAIWGRGTLAGIQADIALITRTIARYEPVVMCANSASAAKARSLCGTSVTVISSIPVDDCWMRDTGPGLPHRRGRWPRRGGPQRQRLGQQAGPCQGRARRRTRRLVRRRPVHLRRLRR
ncbi:agmatine deiminase family protein [Streptomyces cyaneofuscatus]|uniref:agmatine deiminase family protein n=1 Tax=Streptomyces cyaneofuscatus TaxID=66883 RepID=UPI00364BBF82